MRTDDTTGLVLAAGGARGAYQAGALAELLPALARQGDTPATIVGESVGALNAGVLASHAHESPEAQADALVSHWRASSRSEVLEPLWRQVPEVAVRYVGEVLGLPHIALRGLLGVGPLRRSLERRVDWGQLHRNVTDGRVRTLGITATAVTTGRSVTFVEGHDGRDLPSGGELDYRAVNLAVDHLLASAAIPLLFPPVWIGEPGEASGWYVDGSTRLHTPLRPAIDLGADRLVVVGTTSLHRREPRASDAGAVDLGDATVTLLHAMVEDSLRRDVHRLAEINTHLVDSDGTDAIRRLREAQGRPPYRHVPFVVVAPDDPYEIGDLALEVFRERYGGVRALRDPDIDAMHRLLGGDSPLQGEVLSFVLFDEVFHEELIRRGRRDARRLIGAGGMVRFGEAIGGYGDAANCHDVKDER